MAAVDGALLMTRSGEELGEATSRYVLQVLESMMSVGVEVIFVLGAEYNQWIVVRRDGPRGLSGLCRRFGMSERLRD